MVDDPYRNLMIAAPPGGIEAQERQGQREFVEAGTQWPIDMNDERSVYGKLGFVFGDPIDDLFISTTLPTGWSIKETEHVMWSNVYDERSRLRAAVFYKAAFYDRRAHAELHRAVVLDSERLDSPNVIRTAAYVVKHQDVVVYRVAVKGLIPVGPSPDPKVRDAYLTEKSKAHSKAITWMNKHYPDHNNPLSYWE